MKLVIYKQYLQECKKTTMETFQTSELAEECKEVLQAMSNNHEKAQRKRQ